MPRSYPAVSSHSWTGFGSFLHMVLVRLSSFSDNSVDDNISDPVLSFFLVKSVLWLFLVAYLFCHSFFCVFFLDSCRIRVVALLHLDGRSVILVN